MKISTGSQVLNAFLNGGYESDIITTIYGPSGSGKTNLCLLAAVKVAEQGKKVLLIDTEGGIAVDRVQQLTYNPKEVLNNLLFFNPVNFDEQKAIFETLRDLVNEDVGLIVVDSISMLYRLEMGKSDEVYEVNSALGKQMSYLVEIARRRSIPILITNQVYSDFDKRDHVKMVGGDFLRYGSKCLIELRRNEDERKLILKKHRSLPEGKELLFKIINKGIEESQL